MWRNHERHPTRLLFFILMDVTPSGVTFIFVFLNYKARCRATMRDMLQRNIFSINGCRAK